MTVWSDAKQKRSDRRDDGLGQHHNPPALQALIAAGQQLLGAAQGNTQSTIVIAQWTPTGQYFGVGVPVIQRQPLVAVLQGGGGAAPQINWTGYSGDANMHAEMKVVNYVIENNLAANKNALGAGLVIACIGKPVCADCCGWLTRYGVAHGTACSQEGSAMGWRHPLTGANFRGEKDNEFEYSKLSKYKSSATTHVPNPQKIR